MTPWRSQFFESSETYAISAFCLDQSVDHPLLSSASMDYEVASQKSPRSQKCGNHRLNQVKKGAREKILQTMTSVRRL